jgi:hypothetical protein
MDKGRCDLSGEPRHWDIVAIEDLDDIIAGIESGEIDTSDVRVREELRRAHSVIDEWLGETEG